MPLANDYHIDHDLIRDADHVSSEQLRGRREIAIKAAPDCTARPAASTEIDEPNVDLEDNPLSLSFPTLRSDGSLSDITVASTFEYPTPPAALSSLGARLNMTRNNMEESTNSLADDSYDMVDDVSELSNDDRETASLASTDNYMSEQDEHQLTPEETGSMVDVQEERDRMMTDDEDATGPVTASQDRAPQAMTDAPIYAEPETKSGDNMQDSQTSEDMDTPRQSTLRSTFAGPLSSHPPTEFAASSRQPFKLPFVKMTQDPSLFGSPQSVGDSADDETLVNQDSFITDMTSARRTLGSSDMTPQPIQASTGVNHEKLTVPDSLKKPIFSGFLVLLLPLLSWLYFPTNSAATDLAIRRVALSTALVEMMNTTDAMALFDVDHLLPHNVPSSTNSTTAPFQGLAPNHIVIALSKQSGSHTYPRVVGTKVSKKSGREIGFNLTRLIEGVYHVSFPIQEAYGTVNVNVATKNPSTNFTVVHDFGSSFLRSAGTELSKSMNKNLAVSRDTANSLKEKVSIELVASAAATKNATSQLAVVLARDLQVFTNTALSTLGKMAVASNHTLTALSKDIRKDVMVLRKDIHKSLIKTTESAKALIPSKQTLARSLSTSRRRALSFKEKLIGGKKGANSTSATKELSLRLQHFFQPSEKSKKAGSFSDIARCACAKNYEACRQEQKALSAFNTPPSSLSPYAGDRDGKPCGTGCLAAGNGACDCGRRQKKAARKDARQERKKLRKEARRGV